jgi:hypothetical protein
MDYSTLHHKDNIIRSTELKLYKGTFNYSGEIFEYHTQAKSQLDAYVHFCSRIATRKEITGYRVRQHFFDNTQSWKIEEVKENGQNNRPAVKELKDGDSKIGEEQG